MLWLCNVTAEAKKKSINNNNEKKKKKFHFYSGRNQVFADVIFFSFFFSILTRKAGN
jgi:hypothetical protein